jgi:hypothetical protein
MARGTDPRTLNAPLVNPRFIAKELQLEKASRDRNLYFHGESMRPLLVEGDLVVVEPVKWEDIRLGDIITYRYLERFPTRRVMRKSRDGLYLWCDNWPDRHYSCARDDVLGRAIARQRDGVWLNATDREWRVRRARARIRWEYLHARRVTIPNVGWRLHSVVFGTAGRALRFLRLLPTTPQK